MAKDVFIAYQFNSEYYSTGSLKTIIGQVLHKFGLEPFFADEHFEPVHISCEICYKIQSVPICIFEISDGNPNVMFELGLAYMLGKTAILLTKNESRGSKVSDIAGIHRIQYSDLVQCKKDMVQYFSDSKIIQNHLKDGWKEVVGANE